MKRWGGSGTTPAEMVGRTPRSAADAPVGLHAPCRAPMSSFRQRDEGVPRGPGGPPHLKRWLPLLLLPAMLVLAAGAQQESDAAKAAKEKKAKQDAAAAKKDAQQAAKKAPAAPPLLEPVQPVLAWIYPAGGQRGTTIEVTASGTSIVPETVLVTGGGVTGKVTDGSQPNKVKFTLAIARDAEPGERELRILNAGGVSNRFRFMVGELPEIMEV